MIVYPVFSVCGRDINLEKIFSTEKAAKAAVRKWSGEYEYTYFEEQLLGSRSKVAYILVQYTHWEDLEYNKSILGVYSSEDEALTLAEQEGDCEVLEGVIN